MNGDGNRFKGKRNASSFTGLGLKRFESAGLDTSSTAPSRSGCGIVARNQGEQQRPRPRSHALARKVLAFSGLAGMPLPSR